MVANRNTNRYQQRSKLITTKNEEEEKTMLKRLLSFVLATVMLMSTGITAFATEVTGQHSDGFYVTSEDVPQKAIEHVQNSIGGMINDLADLNSVKVGVPFKLSGAYYDLYYFVIYSNDRIIGTYRVYEADAGYTGIFSENSEIIEGLQKIAGLTSPDKPAKIIAGEHDDIYAIIDSNVYTVLEDAAGNSTSEKNLLLQPQTYDVESLVDISKGISINLPQASVMTSPSYKFLQIGWDETQGNLPWCMAYVTASIMRYKTGKSLSTISARKVMEWAYPNLSKAELEATALSTSKADEYANTYDIDPTYTASRRTYAQVASDIIADSPLAFICDNVNTGAKKSHAFVCRGYNDNSGNSFYSIWNPWYSEFERIYTSDNTYVNSAGTAKYLWSATMYGWN
ncbi:hypothetical protein KQI61_19215 [Anaerocolumna aminovalerica]|uniref:C47 family peptidase n=1 Tax=Anaerocolumna aminovalerica TaxID=1527 RepID=UPI001C0EC6AA|nr:hypothetical protein [Anaerocolumna aminovalerica]